MGAAVGLLESGARIYSTYSGQFFLDVSMSTATADAKGHNEVVHSHTLDHEGTAGIRGMMHALLIPWSGHGDRRTVNSVPACVEFEECWRGLTILKCARDALDATVVSVTMIGLEGQRPHASSGQCKSGKARNSKSISSHNGATSVWL